MRLRSIEHVYKGLTSRKLTPLLLKEMALGTEGADVSVEAILAPGAELAWR